MTSDMDNVDHNTNIISKFLKMLKESSFYHHMGDAFAGKIEEQIFQPGKLHLEFLAYLLQKLGFAESLENISKAPTLEKKMALCISTFQLSLGLCQPKDADIIKGISSPTEQASFFIYLLDLIKLQNQLQNEGISLSDQFEKSSVCINTTIQQVHLDSLLSFTTDFVSEDLKAMIEAKSTEPNLSKMRDEIQEACFVLGKNKQFCDELMSKKPTKPVDIESQGIVQIESTFAELDEAFVEIKKCYDEVKTHTKSTPVGLDTTLGPSFIQASKSVDASIKVMKAFKAIGEADQALMSELTSSNHQIIQLETSFKMDLYLTSFVNEFPPKELALLKSIPNLFFINLCMY